MVPTCAPTYAGIFPHIQLQQLKNSKTCVLPNMLETKILFMFGAFFKVRYPLFTQKILQCR